MKATVHDALRHWTVPVFSTPSQLLFGNGLFYAQGDMPKDEWGNLKRRERGKEALRTGAYYRTEPQAKKANIYTLRKEMRQDNATLPCSACGPILPKLEPKTFKDGTKHIEASCPKCNKFLKWIGR